MVDRATDEEPKVAPIVDEACDQRDAFRAVRRGQCIEEGGRFLPVRCPQEVLDLLQRDGPLAKAMTMSSMLSASRRDPCACLAIASSAAGSALTFSCSTILPSCATTPL